jgi:hypothetical protein
MVILGSLKRGEAIMPDGAILGGLLCALVVGVAVGTLIGAVFLRAAIALYKKLTGGASSPWSVPEPDLGSAMWITFAASLAQMVVGALIGAAVGSGTSSPGARGQGHDLVAQLISFPVGLLVMAAVLSAKLPTTFGRAILVTLCYVLITLLVVGILVGVAILVFKVVLGNGG